MTRRQRPPHTRRSEHWLRKAVNEYSATLGDKVRDLFHWPAGERIDWLSPVASDEYAEYYDQGFVERLGVPTLRVPLHDFWPKSGPRWDGLAKTNSGKLILVEAKAYIEEGVAFRSKAGPSSRLKIQEALASAKKAFRAADDAPWEAPFYQYANRLAHLYFMRERNGLDAHLLFLYFADAPDVDDPCTVEQWQGAERLAKKCLGLGRHRFEQYVQTLIWSVPDMCGGMTADDDAIVSPRAGAARGPGSA